MISRTRIYPLIVISFLTLTSGCGQTSRMGMILDRDTGIQTGSKIENNIVVTPGQFSDSSVRLRFRNTSGHERFDLSDLRGRVSKAISGAGYSISENNSFGLLFDVNLLHAGQISSNLASEFAFLGAAAGSLAANSSTRKNIGTGLAGATLGAIVGSNIREDTYIIVAEITIGVVDQARGISKKRLVFGKSKKSKEIIQQDFRGFSRKAKTKIAVYVGGRNLDVSSI